MFKIGDIVRYHRDDSAFPEHEGSIGIITGHTHEGDWIVEWLFPTGSGNEQDMLIRCLEFSSDVLAPFIQG